MTSIADRSWGVMLSAALLTAIPIAAQVTQVPLPVPAGFQSVLATDVPRDRIVLFGSKQGLGANTFEWDGARWMDRRPSNSPSARTFCAMAADPARNAVLLFGGLGPLYLQDTWSWNGRDWQLLSPSQSPPARMYHAMAADTARQRVVLFGGWASGAMNDTWEWDGTTWNQLTPAQSPPRLIKHALAFDPLRQRTVLFGGDTALTGFTDAVWEWDGRNWRQVITAPGPNPRCVHAMTWVPARQRVLLVGGADVFAFPDAWEWDGTQWTGLAAPPVARAHHGLACEAQGQGVILFGGGDSLLGAPRFGDSYRWSGSTWQQIDSDPPPPRRQFAACTDLLRLRTVIQGGMSASGQILDDTFEWDGSRWHQLTSSPGRRFDHAMAYDLARGKTVLFGGSNLSAFSAETWELDGVAWTQASVPGPPARAEHAMAYHTPTLRTVLFGGRGLGPQLFGDTWTFDGIVWQQQQPAQSPSPRTWHAMATDAARASVVLFGGIGNGAQRNDTWKWDGVNWIQAAPPTSPPPRGQCAMAYDWQRQRVVLHGGSLVASNADYWEWDGTTWRSLANAAGQSLRSHHLSYDITSERMLVLFGSRQGDEPGVAVLTTAPAAVSTLGAGCGSTAGPPRFTADAPYLGNRGCALELAGLANAPCLFAAAFSTLSQPLGAGCTLLLAPPITDVLDVTNSSGIAQRVLPIALKPALRGLVVYAQGGVLDPSAPLGFGLTPGLRLAVGD